MISEHHVIIVPGLGNGVKKHEWATHDWKNFGLIPHVFDARWKVEEPALDEKLARALVLVDDLVSQGKMVSLLGNSAGSSFVLNLFGKRKNTIHRVIINCGRVRTGDWPWFTFKQASITSPSFKESVVRAEDMLAKLSKSDLKKILTLRPIFDEVVPPFTVSIEGATNKVMFSVEHVLGIALNMTLYKKNIIKFLQS